MQGRYLGRLEPGMDVCDIAGEKIGTIGRVYRHALEPVSTGAGGDGAVMTAPREEIIELKTGLFGLGKRLYIPFSAIEAVTQGCVFVTRPKEEVESQGWTNRPDYLDELS